MPLDLDQTYVRRRRSTKALEIYITCSLFLLAAQIFLSHTLHSAKLSVWNDILESVLGLIATGSMFVAFRRTRMYSKRLSNAWMFFSVALLLQSLGDCVWSVYDAMLNRSPLFSLPEFFYIPSYVPLVLGLLSIPARPLDRSARLRALMDVGILILASTVAFGRMMILPMLSSGMSAWWGEVLVSFLYPILDFCLLGMALYTLTRIQDSSVQLPMFIMTAFVTLELISNSVYVYQGLSDTYAGNGWLDTVFSIQYIVAGLAAFVQIHTVASKSRFSILEKTRPGVLQFHLPYMWLAFPLALLLINRSQEMLIGPVGLILAATGVVALLIARQALWWNENTRLYGRLENELSQRKRAEEALLQEQQNLEQRVQQRTQELSQSNSQLQREIAARKRIQQALIKSEERYALASEAANDGLWDWNFNTNEIFLSSRWKSILGYRDFELKDTPETWLQFIHAEDTEEVSNHLKSLKSGHIRQFEREYRMKHKAGHYKWVLSRGLAVSDAYGKPWRFAGSMSDITERKKIEERVLFDALHDSLTSLPNRALFLDRLAHLIRRYDRDRKLGYAVLFLDLDHFKMINDTMGHLAGDQLLIAVGRRLKECLRSTDTAARLGGDEFALILEDPENWKQVQDVADRLLIAMTPPVLLNGTEIHVSASIGMVMSDPSYTDPEKILRDADIAMYRAKALGRGRSQQFETSQRTEVEIRMELDSEIRRALEHVEFVVYYQPILLLDSGRLAGFEALIRWNHPQRGLVLPDVFIPTAETSAMVVAIDRWVMREVCKQIVNWRGQFEKTSGLTININMSGLHFCRPDTVENIECILRETGVDPLQLRLEITESVIMNNVTSTTAMLRQLRSLGVQLEVDDFGTGYSSLGYLHQFPLDLLKIDRSFVAKMRHAGTSKIIQTIIALSHDLGMEVVAEGIEDYAQLEALKTLGCEYGQGFLISPAVCAEEATQMIQKQEHGVSILPFSYNKVPGQRDHQRDTESQR